MKEKSFAGWPEEPCPLRLERKFSATRRGLTLQAFDFDSEPQVRLRLYVLTGAGTERAQSTILSVGDAREDLWASRAGFEVEMSEAMSPLAADEKEA